MRKPVIQLLLNPEAEEYERFQRDLREELQALQNLDYSVSKSPPPPGVLDIEEEIVKFIFHNLAPQVAAQFLIEIVRAIIERRGISAREESPLCILQIDKSSLSFPSTPSKEKGFLKRVSKTGEPKKHVAETRKTRRKPKR